jgi:hypothetical protein
MLFNDPNKKVEMLLGAKAGNVISYYKTDDRKKGGVSINHQEICICKYKEMLRGIVKEGLEILGYVNSGTHKILKAEYFFDN